MVKRDYWLGIVFIVLLSSCSKEVETGVSVTQYQCGSNSPVECSFGISGGFHTLCYLNSAKTTRISCSTGWKLYEPVIIEPSTTTTNIRQCNENLCYGDGTCRKDGNLKNPLVSEVIACG